ncbi:hypothetical protein P8452_12374 [Trifolium repens]|nr:hypothetical protein P8452_12374 [Trifolium repens]
MVEDSDECYFRSALRAFERRVVYSNIIKDYIVGWRTTSVREDRENVCLKSTLNEKYPHVIYEEDCHTRDQIGSHNIHGRHLFLTDGTERTHSLLLRMVECYLSALSMKNIHMSYMRRIVTLVTKLALTIYMVSMHGVSPLTSDGLVLLSLLTHCTLVPPLINSSWKTSDSNPC